MNAEIGAEAALFPEKEYINGIFDAVRSGLQRFQGSKTAPMWGRGQDKAILWIGLC
jgi:hypothetical protein